MPRLYLLTDQLLGTVTLEVSKQTQIPPAISIAKYAHV
jgi:hypothetical protein